MTVYKKTAKRAALAAGGILTAVAVLSACGTTPQNDDLNGVNPQYPNYAALYLDVDGYPNVVMECIQGQGFALTQRPDMGAITPISTWNAFCATQVGKKATQIGNGQP